MSSVTFFDEFDSRNLQKSNEPDSDFIIDIMFLTYGNNLVFS